MFIGCAENPFADPFEIRAMRLAKKAAAGAQFVQTQCIFNVAKFEKWMEMVRDLGVHEKIYILAGITPCKSIGMARYMQKSVPGMDVPEELIDAPERRAEGKGGGGGHQDRRRDDRADAGRSRAWQASISWPSNGRKKCRR